jgi:hypothetical protein
MTALVILEAKFIRYEIKPCFVGAPGCNTVSEHSEHEWHISVDTFEEADGIIFLCPKCYNENGKIGTHRVICWFEGKVPDDVFPNPGRWNPIGTGINDLTFVPGKKSNSVLLTDGCRWHGFVSNGDAS